MESLTSNPSFACFSKTISHYPSRLSFVKLTSIQKLEPSNNTLSLFCCKSSSSNPKPDCNRRIKLNPFCVLRPIIRTIKGLVSSQSRLWMSRLRAYRDDTAAFSEDFAGDLKHNGGLGIALLSVTASAKIKISPFVATLSANPTFVSAVVAWFFAQSSKMVINFFIERKWDFRLLYASGGMPSSHSALCMALTTSVALCHGVADSLFPVCLGFSLIVMYDAIGVRRHAGMQAEVLNLIIRDLFEGHPISQRKLKELLGHTPSQVLAGALVGVVIACFCCQGYLVSA
ncbi:unnamed protein product [Arabidopsis lyrata]|uniref:Acid phosphatase/vanadium-dependent haloperoxidase-related protein n=1 Tax=Arabidopsis lyrata subsp. lyrata TaxID=81972 RepID=D7LSP1_ARALL|nr:uncharacterized protein LOC9314480 [Arabidopsis lyrata subsp. lyrata]EFH52897.1 hypothetical protein ARALYDRAFT_907735 [Arabidopsis lyrata subsp. lyrata]CAH8269431.1 unnamed protein product [Arabidopsis lyrata]|eukprot:XP_002876638.1 uncharacterized protein LOC9314480 [Arabidopsis lyrata subsp. lyrata]